VDILHGTRVPDPYRWLEDLDAERTQAWIAAQNEVTFGYLEQIPSRAGIAQRFAELWNYEKYGVPTVRGRRTFYRHNEGLQNQYVLYWLAGPDAEPQLLLDPNGLSEDGTVALTSYTVSEDGRFLAYSLSSAGSDWQEWHVREVDTGRDLADHLRWSKFSEASWSHDGRGFYYSRYDEPDEGIEYKGANYYHKLYYHRLGTSQSEDVLVYERPDEKEWGVNGQVTEDGRYLILSIWHGTRVENGVFYADLADEDGVVVELLRDFDANYTFVGNDGPVFYFKTDLDAPLARVIAIDVRRPDRADWTEVVAESTDALQEVHLIAGRFVALYLHDAYSEMRVLDATGEYLGAIELPGIGSAIGLSGRQGDPEVYFSFTSFTTPGTIYRYDVRTGQSTVFRQPMVAFDPDAYVTEQIFYHSADGTRVPMFLTYKAGMARDGNTPTFLTGYGGFNIPMRPAFSMSNLVWIEMGGICATACLRGGGEYGKAWHEAGMLLNKQNVFDDFVAAAEWLIAQGYTCTDRLAIGGGSNGGLLVGACLTQRPDLFGACVLAVGVLDMLRFQKFTIGWAWTSDFGSPDDPEAFQALLAYSPYHNLKPGTAYPPTLITTGDHDDRVYPAHSFKFAAALQAAQAGSAPVLIRIETRAGHGAGKPAAKVIEEVADWWAFVMHALGYDSPEGAST
jgi:prolyl oligopeptidase